MKFKTAENTLSCLMFISLLTYLYFTLQYPANEFLRPYLVSAYILAGSTLLALSPRLVIVTPLKEIAHIGFLAGALISLIFLTSNYVFRTEVPLKFEVLAVSQGKGDSVNWDVKTDRGERFSLNVRKQYFSAYQDLKFYKGIWGYYFGKGTKPY